MISAPAFAPPDQPVEGCDLCANAGGVLVWSQGDWRAVRVQDAAHPAFYRLICNRHVREFSELSQAERVQCMSLVATIERVLIERLQPTKINLAAFGNMVPHLHWHVIARFAWDSHFPNPVWGERTRQVEGAAVDRLALPLEDLDAAVVSALSTC
jgi:diadenosine tetraphosphate (Ap4A) HIT family hydrolase